MQDEHFMQSWNTGHGRFSADLDRRLDDLSARLVRRRKGTKGIRNPYGLPRHVGNPLSLSPAARASLRGLAASVLTAALWLVVMALATPAPGLAATAIAPVADAGCVTHLLLA